MHFFITAGLQEGTFDIPHRITVVNSWVLEELLLKRDL